MSHFIVEHKYQGSYMLDKVTGVEDIDTSLYDYVLGIWVCETEDELLATENELRRMRHERSSQPT